MSIATSPGSNAPINSGKSLRHRRTRRFILFSAGIVLVLVVAYFREPLREEIRERAILSNVAPAPDSVEAMIQESSNPTNALWSAWKSGKIVHRQVAIRSFTRVFPSRSPLPSEFNALLLSATLDPDIHVREASLGILRQRNHPDLSAMASEQLKDPDPKVRLLGLKQLKYIAPAIALPAVFSLLDDSDEMIVAMCLKIFEFHTGQNFGVKLSETILLENAETGLKEYQEGSREKVQSGVNLAKAWWAQNKDTYEPPPLLIPEEAYSARDPLPAGDFELPALDGQKIRLSNFRGKIVLINFWTTWCPACLSEMPELIVLQQNHREDLVIIGVSLDYVPDSHGHIGGHAAVEEQNKSAGDHDDHEPTSAALERVREKVRRTVKARGLNYLVLLDEKNEVGGRFNGGELPTTVIVDKEGNVRRRFIGARNLTVFQAMIADAQQPASQSGASPVTSVR